MVRVSLFSFVSALILTQAVCAYSGDLKGDKHIGKDGELVTPGDKSFGSRVNLAPGSEGNYDLQVWKFEPAKKDPYCCGCDLYYIQNPDSSSYLTVEDPTKSPDGQELVISRPDKKHAWKISPGDMHETHVIAYYGPHRSEETTWAVELSPRFGRRKLVLGPRDRRNPRQSWEISSLPSFDYSDNCGSSRLSFQ
ncbi:hypothetical protein BGZ67_008232 [Mortierella alpina]|nr:hypothetical protein BGZ67_008232 [Mortierella alpina]